VVWGTNFTTEGEGDGCYRTAGEKHRFWKSELGPKNLNNITLSQSRHRYRGRGEKLKNTC